MDKQGILSELRQAKYAVDDAARNIDIMITAIETDVSCAAERSQVAGSLASASLIIRRSYDQGW